MITRKTRYREIMEEAKAIAEQAAEAAGAAATEAKQTAAEAKTTADTAAASMNEYLDALLGLTDETEATDAE